jgi:hypothetical protein
VIDAVHDEQNVRRVRADVDLAQRGRVQSKAVAVIVLVVVGGTESRFFRRSGRSTGMSVAVYLRARGPTPSEREREGLEVRTQVRECAPA